MGSEDGRRFTWAHAATTAALALALAGCGGSHSSSGTEADKSAPFASAVLEPPPSGGTGSLKVVIEEEAPKAGTIQVEGSGLERAQGSSEYALWLVGPPREMFLVATYHVRGSGRLRGKPELVSPAAFGYIGEEGFTEAMVSKANPTRLRAALSKSAATEVPSYFGTEVLRGRFEGPGVGPRAAETGS